MPGTSRAEEFAHRAEWPRYRPCPHAADNPRQRCRGGEPDFAQLFDHLLGGSGDNVPHSRIIAECLQDRLQAETARWRHRPPAPRTGHSPFSFADAGCGTAEAVAEAEAEAAAGAGSVLQLLPAAPRWQTLNPPRDWTAHRLNIPGSRRSACTIVSPRPSPWLRSRSGLPTWWNSSQIRSMCSGGMPIPVSADLDPDAVPERLAAEADFAVLGVADAFSTRLRTMRPSRVRSVRHHAFVAGRRRRQRRCPLAAGRRRVGGRDRRRSTARAARSAITGLNAPGVQLARRRAGCPGGPSSASRPLTQADQVVTADLALDVAGQRTRRRRTAPAGAGAGRGMAAARNRDLARLASLRRLLGSLHRRLALPQPLLGLPCARDVAHDAGEKALAHRRTTRRSRVRAGRSSRPGAVLRTSRPMPMIRRSPVRR